MNWFFVLVGFLAAVTFGLVCVSGRATGGRGSFAPFVWFWLAVAVMLAGLFA